MGTSRKRQDEEQASLLFSLNFDFYDTEINGSVF